MGFLFDSCGRAAGWCRLALPPIYSASTLPLEPLGLSVSMGDYGAGSQEALDFHLLVYHLATQIPRGHVTTYGHLAYLAGRPENSRQVGYALKHLPTATRCTYNSTRVPWWRVIGSGGKVSAVHLREHQVTKLRQELAVTDGGAVDMGTYGWFPEVEELNIDVEYPE